MGEIQNSINQILSTTAGAVVGAKHIQNQNEQKAISSLGQLETATSQLNLKESQAAEAQKVYDEAENEKPGTDLIAENIQAQGQVDRLNRLDKRYSEQMDRGQSRDDSTGRFISRDEANTRYDDLMDDLKAARKAKEAAGIKLEARQNMKRDIDAKLAEVKLATQVRDQAQLTFEKTKKYLPKGGKK